MKTLKNSLAWAITLCLMVFAVAVFAQEKTKLTDAEIASVAVTANQIDVDYAAIAQLKSKNAEVLRFAKTMHDDHTSVIAKAEALCKKLGVTPKDNPVTQSLLDGASKTKKDLNAQSGNAFDKNYITNEVAYHKAVIHTVETMLIPQTQNMELKDLLTSVLPVLKSHLEHSEMILKDFK